MRFSTFVNALSSAVVASTLVAAQTTHTIVVGGSALTFAPNNIKAAVGDTINFEFHAKNHTATQSTFASPCTPMSGGVDSGYYPVDAAATSFPVWSIQVQDVTPLWFYCAQGAHCKSGMVMAINVNETSPNTFQAFTDRATGATSASSSGAASATGSTPAASGTATGASGTATGSSAAASGTSSSTSGAIHLVSSAGGLLAMVGLAMGVVF